MRVLKFRNVFEIKLFANNETVRKRKRKIVII